VGLLELLRTGQDWYQRPEPATLAGTGWPEHPDQRNRTGPIDTEANRTTTPTEIVDEIVNGLPLSRMGTPDDLVGMCLFLLSDEASWITGQIFNVDGGQIIRS